jgi:hypothetical protein
VSIVNFTKGPERSRHCMCTASGPVTFADVDLVAAFAGVALAAVDPVDESAPIGIPDGGLGTWRESGG